MRDEYWDYAAQLPWNKRPDSPSRTCDGGDPCRHCHVLPVFRLIDEAAGTRQAVARLCLHCGEGTPDPEWVSGDRMTNCREEWKP